MAAKMAAKIVKIDISAALEVPGVTAVLTSERTQEYGEIARYGVEEFVADNVAPYKKVRFIQFRDAIPKSPSGKILRRVLRAEQKAAGPG